jgi:hypothetical protein
MQWEVTLLLGVSQHVKTLWGRFCTVERDRQLSGYSQESGLHGLGLDSSSLSRV